MDDIDFPLIRRQDRLLEPDAALELLERGEYGFLAMCSDLSGSGTEWYGYGIPMSYYWEPGDGQGYGSLWFHCAPEGHKMDALRGNPRVSFCVVGATKVLPYTTAYESVHIFGRMTVVEDKAESMKALRQLRAKYNPELADASDGPIKASFARTTVLRLDIEHLAGKSKKLTPPAAESGAE